MPDYFAILLGDERDSQRSGRPQCFYDELFRMAGVLSVGKCALDHTRDCRCVFWRFWTDVHLTEMDCEA